MERVRIKYDSRYSSRLGGKFRVHDDSQRDGGIPSYGWNRMATSFTVGTELSETNYRRASEVRGKSDTILIGAE